MSKYALLIGINYRGTSSALRGCINDVYTMKKYLVDHRGYSEGNITILTDDTPKKPTGANIMHALSTLILKAHTSGAKELWLHYSGHGSYVVDRDGDEDDRRDETIVPIDYARNGMITDDSLHDYLEHLPASCEMVCIFDCCHSGTILDLKYQYKGDDCNGVENAASRVRGNVVMISGCMDTQTSADTTMYGKWAGAMTNSFVDSIDKLHYNTSCYDLLQQMRKFLKSKGYPQYPQLCCSTKLTDDTKFP